MPRSKITSRNFTRKAEPLADPGDIGAALFALDSAFVEFFHVLRRHGNDPDNQQVATARAALDREFRRVLAAATPTTPMIRRILRRNHRQQVESCITGRGSGAGQ